eukprot:4145864-Amphidinium_carterae.1
MLTCQGGVCPGARKIRRTPAWDRTCWRKADIVDTTTIPWLVRTATVQAAYASYGLLFRHLAQLPAASFMEAACALSSCHAS